VAGLTAALTKKQCRLTKNSKQKALVVIKNTSAFSSGKMSLPLSNTSLSFLENFAPMAIVR
jgi:hypothetical protein